MREIFYSSLVSCLIFTIFSCGKTTEENVNDTVSKTNETVNDTADIVNDAIFGGTDEGSGIIHTKFIKEIIPGNGDDNNVNYCYLGADIKQTDDGGYIIAGCYDQKAWLMKTDVYGKKQWEKTYSLGVNIPHFLLAPWSVIQTSDGGYLLASHKGVLKTDSSGTMLWKIKGFPGNAAQNPYYEDVIEHSNGNYYLVGGPVAEQAIMVKISPTGSVLKTKSYGKSCADDIFRSVIESNDGKLIMVGERTHGNGPYPCSFYFRYYKNIWVVKTGKNGVKIWDKDYGGPGLEKGMDIVRTTDSDGYIVLGQKCDHGGRLKECGSVFKAVI